MLQFACHGLPWRSVGSGGGKGPRRLRGRKAHRGRLRPACSGVSSVLGARRSSIHGRRHDVGGRCAGASGGGGMHAELPGCTAGRSCAGVERDARILRGPAPVAPAHEPADSGDRRPKGLTAVECGAAAARAGTRVPPAPVMVAAPVSPDRLAQTRIIQRPVQVPIARESTGSFDAAAPVEDRSARCGSALALGPSGLRAVVGIWAASGSSDAAKPAAVPASIATTAQTAASPDIHSPRSPETAPAPAPTPVPRQRWRSRLWRRVPRHPPSLRRSVRLRLRRRLLPHSAPASRRCADTQARPAAQGGRWNDRSRRPVLNALYTRQRCGEDRRLEANP